jgi:hypothetical protein
VQGTIFLGFVNGSKELQLVVQILSSLPRINQPSGGCMQYRADHSPAPYAERGSFELPSITLNIFSITCKTLGLIFLTVLLVMVVACSKVLICVWRCNLHHFGVACYQPVLLLLGIDWHIKGRRDGSKLCCIFIRQPET